MTRLSMQPSQQFAEDFKQLRRDIEEIKNAQRIGRDILQPRVIQCLDAFGNPTTYDIVTTPDFFSTGADFTAIFKSTNQDEPWATPFYQAFYGNPTTPAQPGQVSGSGGYLSFQRTEKGTIAYRGSVGGAAFGDLTPIYLKIYMYATDDGVLTVLPEWIS